MTEISASREFQSMPQATPLVSVIISNYNYGCYLAQAIESVLTQTYQNFELIVVDDGSKDNSRAVIDFYQGCLTAIFQKNGGQGEAFNTGIAQSQGEIICFLDADDYFHPDKLAKVVAAFLAHPQWVQNDEFYFKSFKSRKRARTAATTWQVCMGTYVRTILSPRGAATNFAYTC